jgi:hypothetical protein
MTGETRSARCWKAKRNLNRLDEALNDLNDGPAQGCLPTMTHLCVETCNLPTGAWKLAPKARDVFDIPAPTP